MKFLVAATTIASVYQRLLTVLGRAQRWCGLSGKVVLVVSLTAHFYVAGKLSIFWYLDGFGVFQLIRSWVHASSKLHLQAMKCCTPVVWRSVLCSCAACFLRLVNLVRCPWWKDLPILWRPTGLKVNQVQTLAWQSRTCESVL